MKKSYLYLFSILLLSSCANEKYVDEDRSTKYFYSKDQSKVLYNTNTGITTVFGYREYENVTSDVDNFEVLSQIFGKDSKHGYYRYHATKEMDTKTFRVDSIYYENRFYSEIAKNKDFVFAIDKDKDILVEVEGADPDTYNIVNESSYCFVWYKDKNHYYYRNKKTEADRKTMSFEIPLLPYDKKYIFSPLNNGEYQAIQYSGRIRVVNQYMLHDDKKVYYRKECGSRTIEIDYDNDQKEPIDFLDIVRHIFRVNNKIFVKGIRILPDTVDGETFQIIDDEYSKDKNHVYFNFKLLEKADPATFTRLDDDYVKDKNYVFRYNIIIEDANPSKFNILEWGYSKDDQFVFYQNQKIEGANPDYFKIIDNSYAKDDKHVFYNGNVIKEADPRTFEIIDNQYIGDSLYGKDKDHVFYQGVIIPEADVKTFVLLSSVYSKDKNRVYADGSILEGYKPEEFVKDKWGRFPTDTNYGVAPVYRRTSSRDDDDD